MSALAYAGHVVRRHGDEHRVGLIGGGELDGAEDVADKVAVAELDGLGLGPSCRW